MNKEKKILMCGNHIGGVPIIEAILEAGYSFSYFVCLTPEQAEYHNVSGYYDYQPLAKKHNIPVYIPEKYSLRGEKDLDFFKEHTFDLLIQGGWQRLFPDHVLNALFIGALGFHGSADFLPKGRGRSPMNWSIIEGKDRFIMSLFIMKPGVDDGDVIAYKDFDINDFDDIETLYYKYSIVNRDLVLENLPDLLSGTFKVIPQKGEPSYYPKRTAEDGKIDWEMMDVIQITRLVRAVTRPYPGAFAEVEGRNIIIWKARIFDTRLKYPKANYGEVVEKFENKLIVNCLGGLILLDDWEVVD